MMVKFNQNFEDEYVSAKWRREGDILVEGLQGLTIVKQHDVFGKLISN